MKKTTWILALTALLFATSAEAQTKRTVANLPTVACTAGNIEGRFFIVTDADTLADCTSGGGTSVALCICDGGSFIPLAGTTVADMAGSYVPLTKAGQQTMTATGAGNDITLTADDDLVFATGATGSVLFTPGVGYAFAVDGGAAAANGYDIFAETNDITLTVYDPTRTSFFEVNSGGIDAAPATGTYFAADVGGGVDELRVTETAVTVAPTTSFAVDINGGTDELGVSENVVSVSTGILFRIVPTAAPPAACAGGTEGGLYLDADTHLLCVCNATGWVQVADGTTGCS